MRRATRVDHVGAGFAGVCDGTLSAGRILDAIGQLMGEDPVLLRDRTPQAIRLLVEEGFLPPVGEGVPGRAFDTGRGARVVGIELDEASLGATRTAISRCATPSARCTWRCRDGTSWPYQEWVVRACEV